MNDIDHCSNARNEGNFVIWKIKHHQILTLWKVSNLRYALIAKIKMENRVEIKLLRKSFKEEWSQFLVFFHFKNLIDKHVLKP